MGIMSEIISGKSQVLSNMPVYLEHNGLTFHAGIMLAFWGSILAYFLARWCIILYVSQHVDVANSFSVPNASHDNDA